MSALNVGLSVPLFASRPATGLEAIVLNNIIAVGAVCSRAIAFICYKNRERYFQYLRELRNGWTKASDRKLWTRELLAGVYLYVFNPINAVNGVILFLARNVLGLVPYFAWFYFINLMVYWLGGMAVLMYVKPGRFRSLFLYIFPLWLIVLFLFYEWGFFPLAVRLPVLFNQMGGTATSFRVCSAVALLVILPGGIDSGSVDPEVVTNPVMRSPLQIATSLGSMFVTYKTRMWVQNTFISPDAPPGSVGRAFHKSTTLYSTPEGVRAEAYVMDYVKAHGLEDTIDGRFRAWAAYYNNKGFKPSVVFSLAKQRAARSIPVLTAVVLASAAGAVADAADKE